MNAVAPTIGQDAQMNFAVGEIHTIAEPGDGVVIRCTSGAAWVTQAGVSEDIVLEVGMSYRPRAAGKVVIQGLLGAAAISVDQAGD